MAHADEPRLKELILYIADRMEKDQHVGRGRIKLAKLLWRADFGAFWKFGAPITEAQYQADQYGPSPVDELLATRDLQAAERFEWRNDWDRQQIPVALKPANLNVFTAEQIALVDEQLAQYRYVTASAMVQEAHEFPGWKLAWRDGQGMHAPVPFESVFWDDRNELQTWEEEHALSLAQDLRSESSS